MNPELLLTFEKKLDSSTNKVYKEQAILFTRLLFLLSMLGREAALTLHWTNFNYLKTSYLSALEMQFKVCLQNVWNGEAKFQ